MMAEKGELKFRSPLVGRDAELGKLKEFLNNSIKGLSKLALLEGEAGVGKTRLIEELFPHVREIGVDLVFVHCSPLSVNDPYGVFIDIIEKKVSSDGISKDKMPIFEFLKPEEFKDENEVRVDLLRHQSRMFELVSQFLIQLTEDKEMCIIIDDIHYADAQSLKLLHYVIKSLGKVDRHNHTGQVEEGRGPPNGPPDASR
jgi:predicted ATPase